MLILIALIAATIFFLLSAFGVRGTVGWADLGRACIAIAAALYVS